MSEAWNTGPGPDASLPARSTPSQDVPRAEDLSRQEELPELPRVLVAIVHMDVAGYSRLMEADEAGTVAQLRTIRRDLIDPKIVEHAGRIAGTAGDSLLALFSSITAAVRFAIDVQGAMAARAEALPSDQRILLRTGINVGDVMPDGGDLYGDGVNVAARLQAACPVGGICVSRSVRDHLRDRIPLAFEDLGELKLKNISRPVQAYALRFGPEATVPPALPPPSVPPLATPRIGRFRRLALSLAAVVLLCALGTAGWLWTGRGKPAPPTLSVVVLPFNNFGGEPRDDYLADAVTDELTTRVAQIQGAFVIARETAFTLKGRHFDARRVAADLNVRYVLEGSVQHLGDQVRVNAQLIDGATGAHLWADQFTSSLPDLGAAQTEMVGQIAKALGTRLLETEAERLSRVPLADATTTDLMLRVRALRVHPATRERRAETRALLEQVLQRDPRSVEAMTDLADNEIAEVVQLQNYREAPEKLRRARDLLAAARATNPNNYNVRQESAFLLSAEGRWGEACDAYRDLLSLSPNSAMLYNQLAICALRAGHLDEAVSLIETALRLDPASPFAFNRYSIMGTALFQLGRETEAIPWLVRARDTRPVPAPHGRELLAVAYVHSGRMNDARREVAEIARLVPTATVSNFRHRRTQDEEQAAQQARIADALAAAGLRDHADEEADPGLPSDATTQGPPDAFSPTPVAAPGVTTLRTEELRDAMLGHTAEMADGQAPLLLDTACADITLPGAAVLQGVFAGEGFDAAAQTRLRRRVESLTGGNQAKPIVTMSWNSERWHSRNLALQLVALGYQHVSWYRGGVEAWLLHGLPTQATGYGPCP